MKTIAVLFILLTTGTSSAFEIDYKDLAIVKQQVLKYSSLRSGKSAAKLAYKIVRVSSKYNLDPILFSAIIATESNYRVDAVNERTKDYGLTQISIGNVKAYKLSIKKLLTDVNYGLDAGAKILSWFKVKYAIKEPKFWFCRYNVGTRSLKGNLGKICKRYALKVWSKL